MSCYLTSLLDSRTSSTRGRAYEIVRDHLPWLDDDSRQEFKIGHHVFFTGDLGSDGATIVQRIHEAIRERSAEPVMIVTEERIFLLGADEDLQVCETEVINPPSGEDK
jgi:hypothetical protein